MPLSPTYCDPENVDSVLSSEGIRYSMDDDRSGEINASEMNYLDDALQWTQAKINFYISPRYDLSTIAGNTWTRWCHAVLAACQLMRRRGDTPPDGLLAQERQYLEWLQEIKDSNAMIPPDGEADAQLIASSAGMSMSNLTVDHRHRVAKVRYLPRISTNPQGSPGGIPRFPDYSANFSS